jgi:formylglycine-generating enzyme required for sulfatase activity
VLARFSLLAALLLTIGSASNAQDRGGVVTNSVGMAFAKMPAGTFTMGRTQPYDEILRLTTVHAGVDRSIMTEVPQHTVRLGSFLMQTTEVTQRQWQDVMKTRPWDNGDSFAKSGTEFPATFVSWSDAQEFCKRLSRLENRTYRLPTEAEWEYACRAGTSTIFHFGNATSDMPGYGWITDNAYSAGEAFAHYVARQKPNAWGLYDMHGNAWEWCADWYGADYYRVSPMDSPVGPADGENRVIRGGSWRASNTHARSTFRFGLDPARAENDLGFRVVLQLDQDRPKTDKPGAEPKSR